MKERNILLDILKGIAIIAVILYHFGILPNGYLGVEIFLVVAGFFTTKSLLKEHVADNATISRGGYLLFINKRLVRLWPLALIVTALSLLFGWMWMFPWTFKLHCEAIAATSIFANNIVQYITTGDYWASDNSCKPLMHTWYVAIIMQFYIVYPIVFILTKKFSKDWRKDIVYVLWGIFILSLLLYVSSLTDAGQDFYLLPSRLFEFAVGGLIAVTAELSHSKERIIQILCIAITMLLLLPLIINIDATKLRLLLTVTTVSCLIYHCANNNKTPNLSWMFPIAFLGAASYSLYLWHQVLFAFYKIFFRESSQTTLYIVLTLAFVIGIASYLLIEKPLSSFVKKTRNIYFINALCAFIAMILMCISVYFYTHNGVVRDIPEFDICVDKPYDNIPKDYTDRIEKYDTPFPVNNRKNVLVIGDSYGRDWTNVLLESGVDSVMNISYHMNDDEEAVARIREADVIFIANNVRWSDEYSYVTPMLNGKNFYRIGVKSFDFCIERLYNFGRTTIGYYNYEITAKSSKLNEEEKAMYKDRYIDIESAFKDSTGRIKVFTSDGKFITPDMGHLTKAGAKHCAKHINVWKYLK